MRSRVFCILLRMGTPEAHQPRQSELASRGSLAHWRNGRLPWSSPAGNPPSTAELRLRVVQRLVQLGRLLLRSNGLPICACNSAPKRHFYDTSAGSNGCPLTPGWDQCLAPTQPRCENDRSCGAAAQRKKEGGRLRAPRLSSKKN